MPYMDKNLKQELLEEIEEFQVQTNRFLQKELFQRLHKQRWCWQLFPVRGKNVTVYHY